MTIAEPLIAIGVERRNRAAVRAWLYVVCLLIFAMVVVGGATRLTGSGLSITEWQPLLGAIPPLNAGQWQEAFDKYRQIPQYEQINRGMSLGEFQFIYWWEWAHRFLGRLIGIVVLLPLAWFWLSGRLEPRLKPHLVLLFLLGAAQGAVGWWMVASGLSERTEVSQYRLAIHLTFACVLFAYTLWLARGLAPHRNEPAPPRLAGVAAGVTFLILAQIFLGGLVAGLDAGLAFNDWPTMDGRAIPGDMFILEPAWRNFFENPKTVQFIHRCGAYLLLLAALAQYWLTLRWTEGATHRRRAGLFVLLVAVQAAIGVATLINFAPMSWSLLHQAAAVVLLGFAIAHWRGLVGEMPPATVVMTRH